MPNPYTGTLNDPISEAQHGYLGKDWEKFFKLIGGGRVFASAQGPGAPVSLGGAGRTDRGRGSVALPSEDQRIGDEDIFRTNQINAYLGELTDENKLRAQAERDMAAHNQAVDAQSAGRQAAERGLAIANDPGTSQSGAPILGGVGMYTTGQGAPAVNRQAIAAQMAPGQISAPPAKPPVTFGKPEPVKIGDKTMLVRPGSDGQTYDMAGRLVSGAGDAAPADPTGPTTSDEGVELAARNYLTTGQMPPLGMGDKTTRQRILDKAAQLGGAGASISANKADYKADSGSLTKMQAQRDAIGAFEETAGKNIDIFLDTAGKVVDTGSPLMNAPLRSLTGKVLGSSDQAKYDAARQVAINEIAKITSNPTLAGQLSDSARHEVEAFNPAGATLAQTVSVMRLLKQDMGNRITSLDDRLNDIKGRLGGDKGGEKAKDPLGIR